MAIRVNIFFQECLEISKKDSSTRTVDITISALLQLISKATIRLENIKEICDDFGLLHEHHRNVSKKIEKDISSISVDIPNFRLI